ncbi:zinc finger protein 154-like [Drosophila novamexicana]|uniref:zinc finger protein 154-like n=1 Tax=Drosophila novamexicana TaxID=47314 RepID=UPI0011E5CF58|nr:zinc finger protein 154-like [Drosophila novamexicana]
MVEEININRKCAEIHCDESLESKFLIICICGISIVDYDTFRRHFCNEHLQAEIRVGKGDLLKDALTHEASDSTSASDCLDEPVLLMPSISVSVAAITESRSDALTIATDNVDSNCSAAYDGPHLGKQPEQRPYKPRNKSNICTYCGRTFRRRYLLDTHLNIHTGSKPHQCERCGKQFRAISTLTRHLRTHEQRQALQCQHCEKLFTHRSALLSHELRHTQVRRWACTVCDKCFYTRNQMDTHRRKLHANLSVEKADSTDNADTSSAHLPFACELCSNTYRSASTLSTHKLKKHYRLAKYSCEQCDKKFINANYLRQHQLIHVKPEVLIN